MTNEKPNYRIAEYKTGSEESDVLASASLRKTKENLQDKTFSALFNLFSGCGDHDCGCNSDSCGSHPTCSCVGYLPKQSCADDDSCRAHCSCDGHASSHTCGRF